MKRANFIGAPAMFNLNHACRALREAGYHVYLVGSSIDRRNFRDVDVRCILDDVDFDALFPGAAGHGAWLNARLSLFNAALSEWLASRTGLPIDFQFQRQSEANHEFHGPRSALGMFIDPILGAHETDRDDRHRDNDHDSPPELTVRTDGRPPVRVVPDAGSVSKEPPKVAESEKTDEAARALPDPLSLSLKRIDLYDGKYTVLYDTATMIITGVLRYGEPWRDVTGDGLILALVHALENARAGSEMYLEVWRREIGRAFHGFIRDEDHQIDALVEKTRDVVDGFCRHREEHTAHRWIGGGADDMTMTPVSAARWRPLIEPTIRAVAGVRPAERRFKRAVRSLWARGIYPGPSVLNLVLQGHDKNNLGGCQPRWRREVMAELQIPLLRKARCVRDEA